MCHTHTHIYRVFSLSLPHIQYMPAQESIYAVYITVGCGLSCCFCVCKLGTSCVSVCPHVTIIAGVLALRATARQQNNSVPPPFLLLLPPCCFSSPSLLYSVPSLAPHSLPSSHLHQLYLTSSLSFLSTPILSLLSLPPTFPHYADTLDFPVGNVNPSGQLSGNPELSLFSPLCTGSAHLP